MPVFEKRSRIAAPAQEVFDWHAREGAFQRLTPPWEKVKLLRRDDGLFAGSKTELLVSTPIGKRRWLAVHESMTEGKKFVDRQEEGPFRNWRHEHMFEDEGEGSWLIDRIEYEPPFELFSAGIVKRSLQRMFDYRHAITSSDLDVWMRYRSEQRLKILITGGSGFLGSNLRHFLHTQGHETAILTRSPRHPSDIFWDPNEERIEAHSLEGFDAVIHLAGENVSSGRWTADFKQRLKDSRIPATRFLVSSLASLNHPPRIFISSSAIGFYGDTGDAIKDETALPGSGFMADLCREWEAAGQEAKAFAERILFLRTGIVLDARGGALKLMLPAYRAGIGGPLGDGRQWMPWVTLEDWIGATYHSLMHESLSGPVNMVTPEPERNVDFSRQLAKSLGRFHGPKVPRFALRLLFGEMADEALLLSCRLQPAALLDSGYSFQHPQLSEALSFCLGS